MKRVFWFALLTTMLVISFAVAKPVLSQETIPTIQDLGWGPYSTAGGINELGQVVGYNSPEGEPMQAVLWSEAGGIKELGPGIALNINDVGQVVGTTNGHAFVWTEATGMVDIHTLADPPITWAFDINNQGQAVGWYSYGCGSWWCLIPPGDGAFLWKQATGMVDLNELTGLPLTYAFDINENGQIVGNSDNGPYVWSQESGIQYITNNPKDSAYSINDAGQVVGHTENGGTYLWSASSGMIDLGIYDEGYVFINNLGHITGSTYSDGVSHAFFWSQETGLIILPHLATDIEYSDCYGGRSNSSGQISGSSDYEYSVVAVLWEVELPPPTPQKQIALIDIKVDALVNTDILDQGEGTALVSKLDAATVQVNNENNKAARNILGAFLNTVEAFVNSERLTSVQAQPLIDSTNTAINSLP